MITEKDLQEAIAECQGVQKPNASTCIMLAAFLTIQREMFGEKEQESYSYAPAPIGEVTYVGDTEFARIIMSMTIDEVMEIMDELMTTLQVVNPRLYAGVIRKLNNTH